ncbi:MAG: cytochrome c biogenesis protein ResB [Chloroflexi bacterium]|nr:cytochrome c biogenesis protein ResB [Chloroflexota bacterium]
MSEEETRPPAPVLGALDRIYDWLTRTRTALVLIGAVGAVSLLGTLLPQHPGGLEGLRAQGMETGSPLLDAFGLYDVYHAPWFVLLFGLLMFSVLLCTLKRTQRLLRARRKRISLIASLVAHYSMLVVMVGALLGSVAGLSDTIYLAEGETATVPGADFTIRLDRAEERYNTDGSVRDWYSYVTVIEGGQEVKEYVIEVNRPLQHRGFAFYQSEFGQMPDQTGPLPLSPVRLQVTQDGQPLEMLSMFNASQTGEVLELTFTAPVPNSPKKIEVIVLPGMGLQLWLSRYPTLPDKVTLQVLAGETVGMGEDAELLFADEVDTTTTVTIGPLVITLEDLDPDLGMDRIPEAFEQPRFWSGLQVGKNPGIALIFAGFVGMSLGWAVRFLLPIFRGKS